MAVAGYRHYYNESSSWIFNSLKRIVLAEVKDGHSDKNKYFDMKAYSESAYGGFCRWAV